MWKRFMPPPIVQSCHIEVHFLGRISQKVFTAPLPLCELQIFCAHLHSPKYFTAPLFNPLLTLQKSFLGEAPRFCYFLEGDQILQTFQGPLGVPDFDNPYKDKFG